MEDAFFIKSGCHPYMAGKGGGVGPEGEPEESVSSFLGVTSFSC